MHSLVAAAALEQEQDEADDYHHPLPPLPFPPPPPPPPPLPPGLHDHPLLPPPVPRYAYYGAAGGAYPMGFPPPPPPLPLGFDPAAPFPFAPTLSPPPRTGGRKGAGGRKRARAAGGDLLLGPSEAALGGGLFLSPLSSPCYDGYLFSKPRARKPTAVADDAPHAVPFPEAASAAAAAPQLAPLVRALSSRARRFALCEWFYSSLDRGFFNEDAFGGALDAAGLAHLRHWSLTRTEWGAVRAALGGGVGGRPRRLSPAFLRQERQRLAAYRRVIRELQQGRLAAPPPGMCVGDSIGSCSGPFDENVTPSLTPPYHTQLKPLPTNEPPQASPSRCRPSWRWGWL